MSDDPLRHSWFHAIDLGDGTITPGRFRPEVPPNYTLYGVFEMLAHLDLADARCFDVGTMDGIVGWVLAGLGAREVIACDMAPRKTWHIARERLGLEVGYRTPVNALELPRVVGGEQADLIVLSGILYHVFDPLTVLVACREAIRRHGFLIVETAYLYDEGTARMLFNPTDDSPRSMIHSNVYWRPSKRTVHGMLELAGFEVVTTLAVDGRLSVLAQAKRPSEIESRSPRVVIAHGRKPHAHYREAANFAVLEKDDRPAARIRYEGPSEDRFIYRALWEPMVPYQPRWQPPNEGVRIKDLARSVGMHTSTRAAQARATATSMARQTLRHLGRR